MVIPGIYTYTYEVPVSKRQTVEIRAEPVVKRAESRFRGLYCATSGILRYRPVVPASAPLAGCLLFTPPRRRYYPSKYVRRETVLLTEPLLLLQLRLDQIDRRSDSVRPSRGPRVDGGMLRPSATYEDLEEVVNSPCRERMMPPLPSRRAPSGEKERWNICHGSRPRRPCAVDLAAPMSRC